MKAVVYIHGKGGSPEEAEHYRKLFPDEEIIGIDYKGSTPWEAGKEIRDIFTDLSNKYEEIKVIANSIGAYFLMNAGVNDIIDHAYFISPVVDMEKLITDMMSWADVNETELQKKGVIHTSFGEDLSWEYLCYVREHPINWTVPTDILYGSRDNLTSLDTMEAFAREHNASLTVMENGEHWFHTDRQMRFLDNWITDKINNAG